MAAIPEDTNITGNEDKKSVDAQSVDGNENDFHVIDENVDTLVSTVDTGYDNRQVSGTDSGDLLNKDIICHSQDSGINSIENDPESISSTKDSIDASLTRLNPAEVGMHPQETSDLDDSSTTILSVPGSSQSLDKGNGGNEKVSSGDEIQTDDDVDISFQRDKDTKVVSHDDVQTFLTQGDQEEVTVDQSERKEEKDKKEEDGDKLQKNLEAIKTQNNSQYQENVPQSASDDPDIKTDGPTTTSSISSECTEPSQNFMETQTQKNETNNKGQSEANAAIRNENETRVADKDYQADITRDTEVSAIGVSQTRKTNAGDQYGDQKRINSKRTSNLTKISSDLVPIDKGNLDSQPLSHASGQKAQAKDENYNNQGSNDTVNPRNGGTSVRSKTRLGENVSNLPVKDGLDSSKAILITTPVTGKCDSDRCMSQGQSKPGYGYYGDKCNQQINDNIYNSYARATIRRHSIHSPSENDEVKPQRSSVSLFERPFTRQELRRALPRKSFFNSHDKAMKDAGFETDDPIAKRKAERLKARLDRIASEFNPLMSKSLQEAGKELTEKPTRDVKIVVTDSSPEIISKSEGETENINKTNATDETDGSFEKVTSTSKDIFSIRPLMQSNRKKRPGSERIEYVECKPLANYLEYVKDNRQEYLQHLQTSRTIPRDKPIARLIKMGRAFELRHQGGTPRRKEEDVILLAAKALRPRTADSSKFYKAQRERGLWATDAALKLVRPPSDDKRQQEKTTSTNATSTTTATKEEDHPKSELEKRKLKAEDWSRSVTTQTLTKAKIQSLRELGSDDNELTKWWEALKQCHYLRQSHG